jgi:hypothetical protein
LGLISSSVYASDFQMLPFKADEKKDFYCEVTGAQDNTIIKMGSSKALVQGFNCNSGPGQGTLELPAQRMNLVYFNGMSEPGKPGFVTIFTPVGKLKCTDGTGSERAKFSEARHCPL